MKQTKSTHRYGLIGYPVKHSFSKAMHEAAFSHLGIDAAYELFEVKPEELEDFLLNRKDVAGFNITIPHKVEARKILEELNPFDKNAELINQYLVDVMLSGAINTVKRNGDRLEYWNTDVRGFIKSLEQDLNFELNNVKEDYKNVLLIGCGGVGRAVITGLISYQDCRISEIYVYDKSDKAVKSIKEHFLNLPPRRQKILTEKVEFISEGQLPDKIKECQLLVNASPIGMKEGDASIVDKNILHSKLSVYDLVYNRETQLIKDANQMGAKAVNGLGMLLYQGTLAFGLWTGKPAPEDVMSQALQKELEKCRK